MNIHHLELFYHVVRHGGISAAARNMPYGIQQPAVSSQILQLEEVVGVKLFERQPFKLTAAGARLFAFVEPFFGNIDEVAKRLRQPAKPQLRLGAPEIILRTHMPVVLQRLKQDHPELRLAVRSGLQENLEAWVRDREIDLALLPLARKLAKPLRVQRLLRIPLVLMVPRKSRYKKAEDCWATGQPDCPLISLHEADAISRLFQASLKERGVEWPIAVAASSLALITDYVAKGEGAGVSLDVPELVNHPQVRVLPLADFKRLDLAAVWTGELTPMLAALLAEMRRYAVRTWPDWSISEETV